MHCLYWLFHYTDSQAKNNWSGEQYSRYGTHLEEPNWGPIDIGRGGREKEPPGSKTGPIA
jgi:hypothetical protein